MDEFDEIAFRLAEPEWDPEGRGLRVTPATLAAALRDMLREGGLIDVALTGTVTGLRRRSRVVTFEVTETLAGDTTPLAVVPVVAFGCASGPARRLVDGSTVSVSGYLEWKPDWGQLRVIAHDIDVVHHTSATETARSRLVHDLIREGLMSRQAALAVPESPHRVRLITGCGSAAEGDIRSGIGGARGLELDVRFAPMSGPNAATSVAAEVKAAASAPDRPDVIIVARGGGARSDLDWADSEVLARTIATCPLPVWTAIGHADDSTVADQVANRSCATPSAAAADLVDLIRSLGPDRVLTGACFGRAEQWPDHPRLRGLILVLVVLVSVALVVALLR
ncbi:MAG: hypothetical protein OSA99_08360 [Acidimicrobiales bacterium]|nr:hypothetical protein [Acidimicrobiales bacterium]